MKRSIKSLPKRTQEELNVLQELILKYISNVRMIILYGSYARGNHVIWEEGSDFGVPSVYQSDLDILVICETSKPTKVEAQALTFIIPPYDERMKGKRHPAPPQIIVESTQVMVRALRRRHYFYSEVVKEGILFYDDGLFKLNKPEILPYREVKQFTEEEYTDCYQMGERFLNGGRMAKEDGEYRYGSFLLHQACERFYKAFLIAHSYLRPKHHLLQILGAMAKNRSREFVNVFPVNTPEDEESYKKLCKAYIEARYNRHFTVSEEQFEYMLTRTEILREVTTRECTARMAYYEEMAQKEEQEKTNDH